MPNRKQEKSAPSGDANPVADQANSSATGPGVTTSDLLRAIESLKSELKEDNEKLRSNINTMQLELSNKLDTVTEDIQDLKERMGTAETRVSEVEDVTLVLTEALSECLKRQRNLQSKVTDLESRSRRNNIRLFGVREGEENTSVMQFMADFLQRELPLTGIELKIQRAHRVPAQKPRSGAPPRPIVVNFQEFTTKELILREAWRKGRIQLNGNAVYFDHDYATEIVQRRKEYQVIKKALKERGVRFQTPYTSIRVHWQDGVAVYRSAHDAGCELQRRGYDVQVPATSDEDTAARIQKCVEWQRGARPRREMITSTAQRAKERLREFQRGEDERL
uniref:L1 transposable element RRM domain-containing protein n=1 Tax=Knipowitschia caucasica TaxID=637954 RepID=A0AAV2KV15_KNICA